MPARGLRRNLPAIATFNAIDAAVGREGWKIVGLTRLSPIFPFNLLNYAYGLTSVSLRDYFFASWIGMLPGVVMYTYIGSLVGDLTRLGATLQRRGPPAIWILNVVGFAATVAVVFYTARIARQALAQKTARRELKWTRRESCFRLLPTDDHNRRLAANVHPDGWVNPPPASRYNLVVIGAGTAGLVIAAGAAGLGAKVALIERDLMGGDCLNFGCVPSKAMIRASRAAAAIRDCATVRNRVAGACGRGFRRGDGADAAAARRPQRQRLGARFRGLGVDVFIGDARFSGRDTVAVGETTLRFRRAAIATGARAAELPIAGTQGGRLSHQRNRLLADRIAARIAVIGGGPLGCELAQALRRFGAEVAILEVGAANSDSRGSRRRCAGRAGARARRRQPAYRQQYYGQSNGASREKLIRFERDGVAAELVVDEIIVGVGRAPAVAGLNLEAAGVAYDQVAGVAVDDYLRTTNPQNLRGGRRLLAIQVHSRCRRDGANRDPQRALLWPRPHERTDDSMVHLHRSRDCACRSVRSGRESARNQNENLRAGIRRGGSRDPRRRDRRHRSKCIVAAGSDRIVGATVVASHASEMISEITLAIAKGIGLGAIADVIHPYPTQAEALRKLGDQYNRTRLTPRVKRIFERWLAWTR